MSPHRAGQEPRFPELRLMRVARTASTQDVVLRAAREGADEGFCCVAAEQTAGRGRQGRTWVGPPGPAPPGGAARARRGPPAVRAARRRLAGILCEIEPAATGQDLVAVALGLGV